MNTPSCLDFQELQSVFGECKSNIGVLRKNIIEILLRFDDRITEDELSGQISEIKIDKETGKLHSEIECPITFSCNTMSDNFTMYLWYDQGKLHKSGKIPAVILSRNKEKFYEEIWRDGVYKRTKLKLSEIKTGVPHPRRPFRI